MPAESRNPLSPRPFKGEPPPSILGLHLAFDDWGAKVGKLGLDGIHLPPHAFKLLLEGLASHLRALLAFQASLPQFPAKGFERPVP